MLNIFQRKEKDKAQLRSPHSDGLKLLIKDKINSLTLLNLQSTNLIIIYITRSLYPGLYYFICFYIFPKKKMN
jgi:hypothetical protein